MLKLRFDQYYTLILFASFCQKYHFSCLASNHSRKVTPYTGITSPFAKFSWTSKARNMYKFCCQKVEVLSTFLHPTTFRNLKQSYLFQDKFDSRKVKRTTSLFNSFCTFSALFTVPFLNHQSSDDIIKSIIISNLCILPCIPYI